MVTSDAHAVPDGVGDYALGVLDGGHETESTGEPSRDGRRVGAARAMRGHAPDERGRQDDLAATVPKDIHGVRRGTEVASLDEEGATMAAMQLARGLPEIVEAGQGGAQEVGGLVEVGGGDAREGQQLLADGLQGVGLEQDSSRGGDHDRIHDERWAATGLPALDDHADEPGIPQHASLGGARREFGEEGVELGLEKVRGDGLDGADASRGLGGEAGDGGDAMDSKGLKGLEVGLDAGAAAGVRACDGEGDGPRGARRHGKGLAGGPWIQGGTS